MDAISLYNSIHQVGGFNWADVALDDLPPPTKLFVSRWLTGTHTSFKLHQPVVEGCYLFKLEDSGPVHYLLHNAEASGHIWADGNFENIDNNTALSILASKISGLHPAAFKTLFDEIDQDPE